jgi:hypothetical protein
MKILMFSITPLFPDQDMVGGQKHLRTIAMYLSQRDHDVFRPVRFMNGHDL